MRDITVLMSEEEVREPSALDEKVNDGDGKGNEVRKHDGESDALGAVEYARHAADEEHAHADHAQFFDQVYHAVGYKFFVSPQRAANDRVDGIECERGQKDHQQRHASGIGKEEIEKVVPEKQQAEHGHGKGEHGNDRRGNGGMFGLFIVLGAVFGDKARNGQRDPRRGRGNQNGKNGQGELIQPHAFRAERAR